MRPQLKRLNIRKDVFRKVWAPLISLLSGVLLLVLLLVGPAGNPWSGLILVLLLVVCLSGAYGCLGGFVEQSSLTVLRQAILDRSSVGIFLTNPKREIVDLSEQAAFMFGYTRQELIGKTFRLLHLSEEKYLEAATYFKSLMAQGYHSMEYGYRHKDGSVLWCSVSGTLLDPDDFSKGTVWTLIDISERKRMEQEVRESEERYSAMVNGSPSIVLIHIDGKMVFINEAGLVQSGYALHEVIGANIFQFMMPSSRDRVLQMRQQREPGREFLDYEIEFIKRDKSLCNLVVKSTSITFEGKPATMVILMDITERKRAEASLAYRESLEQQLTLFATQVVNARIAVMPSVLAASLETIARHCSIDRVWFLRCNSEAGAMRLAQYWDLEGIAPEQRFIDCIEKSTTWLRHLRAHEEVVLDDISKLDDEWTYEREVLFLRGTRSIASIPIVHSQELMGCLLFVSTGRQRKWLEDEIHFMRVYAALLASSINRESSDLALRESNSSLEAALFKARELADQAQQASRSKSQFLANMSHELRTPLNVILGMGEILSEGIQGPLNPDQLSSIHAIEESGRHLLSLINDILDLAKIEAGRLRLDLADLSLRLVCEASLRMVEEQARKKSIHLSLVLPASPQSFRADEVRMKQILINLLGNAVKFTADHGKVGLVVEHNAEQSMLVFTVVDSGIGIPADHLDSLFQPFVQVDNRLVKRHGGTGLGLALVRHFVAMHGGVVQVQSQVGIGSRFTVRIPYSTGAAARVLVAPAKAHDLAHKFPPGLRVLVAEDHPGNASVLASLLKSRGLEATFVENGRQALEQCSQMQPDFVLMDVQMPEMDGLEATRRLKADPRTAAIPVICLTAYAMASDRAACLAAGADGYLSKPIDFYELFELMGSMEWKR